MVDNGPRCGVVTNGGDALHYWSDRKCGHLMPYAVDNVVDVNGAGDALAGACLAYLSRGKSIEESILGGMKAAAMVLSHNGPFDFNAAKNFARQESN
jgi:sugar/nucleoside kinase (ribokinase family)